MVRPSSIILSFTLTAVVLVHSVLGGEPPFTPNATVPEQLLLSLTGSPTEMAFVWLTPLDTATSTVKAGTASGIYTITATGTSDHYGFPDPPPWYRSGQIHKVVMEGLKPDTVYYYVVGDAAGGWSNEHSFLTAPSKYPIRLGVVGDMGATVDHSRLVLDAVIAENEQSPLEVFFIPGDLSYADGNQTIWDIFGRMISPLFSHLPFMVAVGNHEAIDLFIAYNARFNMPYKQSGADDHNMYYSVNYRDVHFLMLDSEALSYDHKYRQYEWLAKDLAGINRTETPWVIAQWHTPWYCSNKMFYNHGKDMRDAYEDLLNEYGVDLVWNGHVHAYQRTTPIFQFAVNASGPVYITIGTGGNREGLAGEWVPPTPDWSETYIVNYGFGTFDIYNATHGLWQFRLAANSTVVDEAWIVRNRDGLEGVNGLGEAKL